MIRNKVFIFNVVTIMISYDIIIQQSQKRPVIVYFSSHTDRNSQKHLQHIETLAIRATEWILFKLDVREHSNIRDRFHVTSAPDCLMLYKGELIARFKSDLTKREIDDWLDEFLPNSKRDKLYKIINSTTSYPEQEASDELIELLGQYPTYQSAQIEYARHILYEQPVQTLNSMKKIMLDHPMYQIVEAIINISEFLITDYSLLDETYAYMLRKVSKILTEHKIELALDKLFSMLNSFPDHKEYLTTIIYQIIVICDHNKEEIIPYYQKLKSTQSR